MIHPASLAQRVRGGRSGLPLGLLAATTLIAAAVVSPSVDAQGAREAAITSQQRRQVLLATVQLGLLSPDGKQIGHCSGSIVDPSGVIVTNNHCARITDQESAQALGRKVGDLMHPEGLVVVSVTQDPKQPPKPTYQAKYHGGNEALDIAVFRIDRMLNAQQRLPSPLPIVAMPLGDAMQLEQGDPIHLAGFPGIGGITVNFNSGTVNGFDDNNNDGRIDTLKTSARTGQGNSGGPGVNDRGEQVGLYWGSSTNSNRPAEALGNMTMSNEVLPYVQQALAGGVEPPRPPQPGPAGPGQPTPPAGPQAGTPSFTQLVFGTGAANSQLQGQAIQFQSGATEVAAAFTYTGMQAVTDWGYEWIFNDRVVAGQRSQQWDSRWGDQGTLFRTLHNNGQPLPDGKWGFVLYLNGTASQRGAFTIGGNAAPTPPPAARGTVVSASVIDADTNRPIAGASIRILKPGADINQWAQAQPGSAAEQQFEAARAVANQQGVFQTTPPIAPAKGYTLVVLAKDYQARALNLNLEADAPAVFEGEPIALKKR